MQHTAEPSPNIPQEPTIAPSHLPFPVVGIGASAGGFQAVKTFFANMPRDNGMAFVVIFHLNPTHESIAHQIIQESTQMSVTQVTSTTPIEFTRAVLHTLGREQSVGG